MKPAARRAATLVIFGGAILCLFLFGQAAAAQDSFNSNSRRGGASWDRCAHSINNAIFAFWIAGQAREACTQGARQPLRGGVNRDEDCWAPLDAALAEVEAAERESRDVNRVNAHNRQANADLRAAAACRRGSAGQADNQRPRDIPSDVFNSGGRNGADLGAGGRRDAHAPPDREPGSWPGRSYGVTPAEVLNDARAAAHKIEQGAGFDPVMKAVARLMEDQSNLPEGMARPTDCLDAMMSAKNWSQSDPRRAKAEARRSTDCYERQVAGGYGPPSGDARNNRPDEFGSNGGAGPRYSQRADPRSGPQPQRNQAGPRSAIARARAGEPITCDESQSEETPSIFLKPGETWLQGGASAGGPQGGVSAGGSAMLTGVFYEDVPNGYSQNRKRIEVQITGDHRDGEKIDHVYLLPPHPIFKQAGGTIHRKHTDGLSYDEYDLVVTKLYKYDGSVVARKTTVILALKKACQ